MLLAQFTNPHLRKRSLRAVLQWCPVACGAENLCSWMTRRWLLFLWKSTARGPWISPVQSIGLPYWYLISGVLNCMILTRQYFTGFSQSQWLNMKKGIKFCDWNVLNFISVFRISKFLKISRQIFANKCYFTTEDTKWNLPVKPVLCFLFIHIMLLLYVSHYFYDLKVLNGYKNFTRISIYEPSWILWIQKCKIKDPQN